MWLVSLRTQTGSFDRADLRASTLTIVCGLLVSSIRSAPVRSDRLSSLQLPPERTTCTLSRNGIVSMPGGGGRGRRRHPLQSRSRSLRHKAKSYNLRHRANRGFSPVLAHSLCVTTLSSFCLCMLVAGSEVNRRPPTSQGTPSRYPKKLNFGFVLSAAGHSLLAKRQALGIGPGKRLACSRCTSP
jgi:hypothetical protein